MKWALYIRNWQCSPQWFLPLFFISLVSNTVFAQCPPILTATPATASLCIGDSINLSCSPATGTSWQWYENGVAIPGATGATYYGKHDGNYYVMTDICPIPSNTINVVMKPLPVITLTSSLATMNACDGQEVTITVHAGADFNWLWLSPILGVATNPYTTTLVNTTTFQVVGVDNITSCPNSVSLTIPVVPPLQSGSIQSNSEVCINGIPPLITGTPSTGSNGIYIYQWQISTTSATAGFSDIPGAVSMDYQPGNISVNTWFRRRVSASPCPDLWSNAVLVQVNPAPIGNNATRNRCSGSNVNYTPTSNIPGSTYTWIGDVTSGLVSGVSATGSGFINDALTLPGGSSTNGLVTYTITPIGPAPTFCVGNPFTLVVTVFPTPLVTTTPLSQDMCSGAISTPVVLLSSVLNSTFTWSAVASAGLSGYQVSGNGNIPAMQIFSTLTTTGTVTYTIIPIGPGPLNCTGPAATYTINIFPSPGVTNSPMQQTICSGGNTTLVTLTSNIVSTSFTWTATAVPAGMSGYTASGAGTIPVQTITNPTNVQGIVTYNIVPSGSVAGCAGIPRDYFVYVNPLPSVVATPGSQVICSGQSTNIALTSPVANTTFSWTATAPAGLTGFSNSNGNTIAQNIINSTTGSLDVTYVITPVSLGCTGPSTTVVVSVSPTPALTNSPLSQTICSDNSTNINLTGTPSNVSFAWTATGAGVTGYSNSSGTSISQTLTNNSNIIRTVVYAITASANGCSTAPVNYTVTVNPNPTVTNSPLTSAICSGSTFNLALSSNVATTTYNWVANATPGIVGHSNGNGLSISQSITNPTNASGAVTYTITPTANGCLGPDVTYGLTVEPIPNLNLSLANQTICSGTSTTPITFSSGVSGTTYNWTATPSGAGISGYTSSGNTLIPSQVINSTLNVQGSVTYSVIPTYHGCAGANTNHLVTINPLPLVTNLAMTQAICSGDNTALVNLTSNVATTTYAWIANPSSAAIIGYQTNGTLTIPVQSLFNSALIPETVTYQIIPTSNFGLACQGTTANYVTTVNPIPSITSSLAEAVCSAQPFNYTIFSDIPGSSFTWSRTVVSGISNPTSSATSSIINEVLTNLTNSDILVTYMLTPIGQAPTLCAGTSVNLVVTVRALPQINAGMDLTILHGTSTSITGSSSGGTGTLSYSWTPLSYIASGANSLTPATINLTTNRTFTLNVTDAAGCTNNSHMTVFVTGSPLASVPSATPSGICIGGNTTIHANASGGSGSYTYSWVSLPAGFTSAAASFVANPVVSTVYQVTVNDGYSSVTSSVAVSVNPLPVQYVLTGGGSYCAGGTGVVVGLAGSQSGVIYQLLNNGTSVGTAVLGNGASLSFGNQTLSGIYTVNATVVATGCTNNMGSSVSIGINSLPIVDAGIDQTIPYGTTAILNGSVSGGFGTMTYSWTPITFIAVGSNLPAPLTTNLYSNTTFALQVTDANNCSGSNQVSVFLSGHAISVIASANPDQICADASLAQLEANTTGGGTGPYSYLWTCVPAGSPVWSSTLQNPEVSPDVTTTYTVVASDGFNTATASATIVVHPLPLKYSVTGGGSYCFAGTGVAIGLNGSETNINYQLFRGGVADGPAVTGNGNPISFGLRTAAFTYTVIATNNITGCINEMNGNATIIILPPPTAYLVTGGGSYPAGGPGRDIGLSFGDPGISYQLFCNNIPQGLPVLGNNTPIDFGLQTQAGTYTVVATNTVTGCTADMNGSVDIFILPLPTIFQVLGGGEFCQGQPGLPIQLSGSEAGVNYQLLLNGFPFGPAVSGTNNPLTWGPFTTAGLYEVRGINASTAATQMMNDRAVIIINPLPTVYTMSPFGSQCPGTIQRLNGSELGIKYYLQFNGIVVDSLDGTGLVGFLNFGPQTISGTYTILAINLTTGCEIMMNESTFIEVAPQIFNVIPAGILCPGQTISISGSQIGVNYQLRWNGTFDLGLPVAGTGNLLAIANVTLPGIYSVIAIDAVTNCVSYMNDSATLYPDPTAFTVVPDGTACEGNTVGLNGSQLGVDYVLYLDGAIQLDTIHGTGFPIDFGPQPTEGNYTILAIDQTSYCIYSMNGAAILNDSPIKYSLTPSGIQCIGTTLDLSDSQPGVEYQLILNGIFNIGIPVLGTGGVISFGIQNLPGTYTVRAVNSADGCNSMMSDSTILEDLPLVFAVTPSGVNCAGSIIGINGSQLNVNYILVLNGSVNLDTIPGTGNAISFAPQLLAGTYTVLAYHPITNCVSIMTGNSTITAAPVIYTMTPAGIVCSGAAIGLANSDIGISYQLRNGLINTGSAITGTGAAISFGTQTLPGTYSIVATDANGCASTMNGTVVLHALPVAFNITPNGSYCMGTNIGLNGSEIGVNYILVLNSAIYPDTLAGTGSAINFGIQITSGTYTIMAYNTTSLCQMPMNGFCDIKSAPLVYTLTPAGILCEGQSLGLDNSEIGVNYQLRRNGIFNVGLPIAGTGSAIGFGIQTIPGIYTVEAIGANNCASNMNGSAILNANPVIFTTGPAGSHCPGTLITLNGSEIGKEYILIRNGVIYVDTLLGTGAMLNFGAQLIAGTYSVIAYLPSTPCFSNMTGSSVIYLAPTAYNVTPAGIICAGTSIGLDNSEIGVNYQLRRDGAINVGAVLPGTGSALNFGIINISGTYTVIATSTITGCGIQMNGSATLQPMPLQFSMQPLGSQCSGVTILLNGSQSGTDYVLVLDNTFNLDTIPGTGNAIDFGPQMTTGIYTIIAIGGTTTCQSLMIGSTNIMAPPASFNLTPAGLVCSSAIVGLDGSEIGVNYVLYKNAVTTGIVVSGTGNPISFGLQTNGTYTIIATQTISGCSITMPGTLLIGISPVATAGSDITICADQTAQLNGSTTHASTAFWTSLGDGFLDNSTQLNAVYTPGPIDIMAGSAKIILWANGNGACGLTTASDTITVTLLPLPQANAGLDITVCTLNDYKINSATASSYSTLNWSSSGTGSFIGDNTLTPTYNPSTADLTAGSVVITLTVTGINPCSQNVSDNLTMTFTPTLEVNAGNDDIICEGNSFSITTANATNYISLQWISSGTGSFTGGNTLSPIYTPSPADIASGSILIILKATSGAPCNSSLSDTATLTFVKAAIANAGADASVCENNSFVIADASASNYTSILWSTSGTGGFNNSSFINPVYTPSIADIAAGNVILTLLVNGNNPCSSVSDTKILTIIRSPMVNAGTDTRICTTTYTVSGAISTNCSTVLWTILSGSGTLTGANTISPTYTPSAADIANGSVELQLTGNPVSPCIALVNDNLTLFIDQTPVVNAGMDENTCDLNNFTVIDATATNYSSLLWTANGTGTIMNSTTLNPTYIPTTADLALGSVTLTFTASNIGCGLVTDSKTITFTGYSTANAGVDLVICEGSNVTIGGASVTTSNSVYWTTSGNGAFTNGNTLTPTYTPSASDIATGIITLSLHATAIAPCLGEAIDQAILTIKHNPTVHAGADATICEYELYTNSDATAANYTSVRWVSSGSGTFDNENALISIYNPSNADVTAGLVMLTLTASNAPCSDVSDSKIINLNAVPIAIAGPNAIICNTCVYQISGAAAPNSPTVLWLSSGSGTFSNSTILNPVYIPSTTDYSHGSVTLSLIAYGIAPCPEVSDQMTLTFSSTPNVDFTWGPACENEPISFYVDTTATNVGATISWNWNFGDGSSSLLKNPTHLFSTIGQHTVTLSTLDTLGNAHVNFHEVFISQPPTAFFAVSPNTCSNAPVTLDNQSWSLYGYIAQTIWNYGDGTPNDTINWPDNPDVIHLYDTSGMFNVTMIVTNSFGCLASITLPVEIIEAPIANFSFANDCSNTITAFFDASAANGPGNTVQYWWDFGDPATGINNFSNLKNPEHIFSLPGIYSVMHVVTNYNNCNDTIVKTITILQPVAVDFIYDHICLNGLANFGPNPAIMNTASIASWYWDFGDGTYSYQQQTTHTFATAGNYQVTLTVTDLDGCIVSKTRTVVVNPLPVALFNIPQLPCANQAVAFDDLSNTYAGHIISWNWNFGDGITQTIYFPANGDIQHTYSQPGNYLVTLNIQASDSCFGIAQQNISIAPTPTTNFEFTSACKNSPVQFTDLSQTGGTGVINGWSWNFGDDISGWNNYSTIENPLHTYATAGNYIVTLTVSTANGCTSTLQRTITVGDSPFVDFSYDKHCQNASVQFSPTSGVIAANVQSWLWNFGDGLTSSQSNPQHIYTQSGNYIVTLTIVNHAGCSNNISHPISILPEPIAAFISNAPACSQHSVQFTNQSVAPAGYIVKWEWNFGDGQSAVINFPGNPSVSHTYSTYGSYTVVLTVTTNDNCTSSISKNIQVLQSPLANFNNDNNCAGGQTQFNDLSQGNLVSWYWTFGDPGSASANSSTLKNPTHQYQQSGTYQVSLMVLNANGCSASINKSVVIAPKPATDFSFNNGCAADTVQFVSSTYVNVPNTASWLWTFGDGNTSNATNPLHVYAAIGTYSVSLTITDLNGCTNTKTRQVQVSNPPTALFSTNAPVCKGKTVNFNDISSSPNGTITTWHWDFGDGTFATIHAPSNPDVTHQYALPGIYDVVLNISTSTDCEDNFTTSVSILSSPVSAFSALGNCAGQTTQFTDLSQTGGPLAITSWYWNFGDATSGINNISYLQNPIHQFSHAGNFTVTLIAENEAGCANTLTQTITITEKPGVGILVSQPSCDGTPVAFSADPTLTNLSQIASYEWSFGDGTAISPLASPEHLYAHAGNYNVTLTISNTNGCENSVNKSITIHSLPVAQYASTRNCTGNLTEFTDMSFNPDGGEMSSWMWDFGVAGATDDTSSATNPLYGYANTGAYNVTLTVTSDAGCSHTTVSQIQVVPQPHAQFSYIPEPCHNGSALFTDESFATQSNITGWYWEFTPGHYSTLQSPVYVFGYTDTIYNVKLVVNNQFQCTDTAYESVYIPSGLEVALNYTNTCNGEITYFTSSIIKPTNDSIVWYNWNFGDHEAGINNISTQRYPEHKYSKAGTYVVTLEATDENNCTTTSHITVVVWPIPQPKFSYFGGVCDSIVMLHDLTTNANINRWIWQFGDGKADTINAPQHPDIAHFYTYPGIYLVTLTTISNGGCINSITDTIRRTPCMESAFSVLDTVVCQNRTMYFTESSTSQAPIASWQWFFGDGTSATFTNAQPVVTHDYTLAGSFTVTMVIATQMVGGMVTDSTSKQVVVKPAPRAGYTFKNACLGNAVPFTNTTINNNTKLKSYSWNFGDPYSIADTSTMKHTNYKYGVYGEYTVKLVAINTLGCSDTVVHTVGIYQHPNADFKWTSNCESKPVHFNDQSDTTSSSLAKWNWYFGGNGEVLGASTGANPSYVFGHAGIYDADLVITDKNGCTDSIRKQIAINSSPVAAFSVVDNYENVQGQIQLNNGTLNGTHYLWDFGNGKTSGAQNPTATFEQDGLYKIQLITWNGQNCADTLTQEYKLLFKGLFVPNAFNPGNLDPEVGIFKPKGTNLLKYHIEVLDRWGNPLWSSNKLTAAGSPVEAWDGTMHGEILPEGVYVWRVTAMFRDGKIWDGINIGDNTNMPQYKTGTVTLIR